jgi:amino acid adenylation domain-containing protein
VGIGPEIPVLLCFEKSKWHVLASLAVLKAGGVCVSVDPTHPDDRLRTIAEKAKATIALCTESLLENMRRVVRHVIPLSSETMEGFTRNRSDATFTCSAVGPTNAAFIVFTSGSTGKPKGIVQEHGAFCWASERLRHKLGTKPGRRVLQFAAYTFDISIVDTFITLMYGACLCIPSTHERLNDLPGFINRAAVNQACITPTVARTFQPEDTPGLKVLCLAGEVVTRDNIATWSEKVDLLNAYGPAEVSVAVLCKTNMTPDTHPADTGRPIGGGCWIVSKNNPDQLVPIGAIGELLTEGPHVARGYLHDPKLTKAAFLEAPIWFKRVRGHDNGHRFYRTGDLVRYQRDGSIYFLGRADSQVKVRGQRVELGEVEHQIYASQLATNAVVLYPASGILEKTLVAIVSFPGLSATESSTSGVMSTLGPEEQRKAQIKVESLKRFLSGTLPQYMLPSTWITLSSLPTSSSGKLDRKSLQDWVLSIDEDLVNSQDGIEGTDKGVARPQTEAQVHLANALSWVLNLPVQRIDMASSFLKLGGMSTQFPLRDKALILTGDSVSAMAVVSRCRHDGKITITVKDLLQAETLQDLADRAKKVANTATKMDPEMHQELGIPFDLTPIQHMFLAATSSTDYSQSFLLQSHSIIADEAIREALNMLVQRHSMLRARFQQDSNTGTWKQHVVPFDPSVYSIQFWGPSTIDDIYIANSTTRGTLNMRTSPVFAANVFLNEKGTGQVYFLTAHHMIIDLVSWRIILRDLEDLLSGAPVRADKSTYQLSFEAWARLQRDFARRLLTTESKADTEVLVVPTPNFGYWGMDSMPSTFDNMRAIKFQLSPEVTSALLGPANAVLSTEPMEILLGVAVYAFGATFSDRSIPAFFTESHGRESWHPSIDPSETVGWFTTMYPVTAGERRPRDVIEAIAEAKDACRQFPDKGFAWFSSQFLVNKYDTSPVRGGAVEFIFNYFGMYQQLERDGSLFKPLNTREMQPTEDGGAGTVRMSLLEMDVAVYQGRFQVSLLLDRRMKHQDQLAAFMHQAQASFEEAARILPGTPRALTASDIPLMGVRFNQVTDLMRLVHANAGLAAADVESMYPCTSMQEDLLTSQMKGLGYYNTRLVWKAAANGGGSIDCGRLAKAWRQQCSRHAILRSTFMPDPSRLGRWFQVVARHIVPSVEIMKLQTLERVKAAIVNDMGPDFNRPHPRHRLKVWPIEDGTAVCQVDISHVLIDGAATEALMRDWAACYNGKPQRQAPRYEPYVAFLQSNARHDELEYWTRYVQGMPPARTMRTKGQCVASSGEKRRLRTEYVASVPAAGLRNCCETYEVTPACIFRAAWAMTLRKCRAPDSSEGADDVVFGYLAHGRDAPVVSAPEIVGPMVVTLPCWARAAPDIPLPQLLRQVQQDMAESLGAQSVSWGEVQRACGFSERPFDTLVNYRKAVDAANDTSSELCWSEMWTYDPMDYAIVMEVEQGPEAARVCLNFWDPDLAMPAIVDVANQLRDILGALIVA